MTKPKIILSDVSWVLIFPREDEYDGQLSEAVAAAKQAGTYAPSALFRLNKELLTFLKQYQHICRLMVLTAGRLHEEPEFKVQLDQVFEEYFLEESTRPKSHRSAYEHIAGQLGVQPQEIIFFDDKDKNVAAARAAGCIAMHYKTNEQLIQELRTLLST